MSKNLTKTADKLLNYFYKFPSKEEHIRGLAQETGISYSSTRKALAELYSEGLLEKREESKMTFYSAKFNSSKFRQRKRIHNIQYLFEKGAVDRLDKKFKPDALVLFGSFLEGSDREGSDIDLAIINGRDQEIDLSEVKDELNRKFHFVQVDDLEKERKEFKNTLANGFVLSGYIEVVA